MPIYSEVDTYSEKPGKGTLGFLRSGVQKSTCTHTYSDEGIIGTSTKRRDGFNQMVADALAGKIDLIVTKSVSRFARNTVDSLVTVRKLKEHGTEIFFEKENIGTLDSNGELLITIMSSLAHNRTNPNTRLASYPFGRMPCNTRVCGLRVKKVVLT